MLLFKYFTTWIIAINLVVESFFSIVLKMVVEIF